MEGIEFNNESMSKHIAIEKKLPKMVSLVMKLGVSDPKKANYILLVISLIFIIISFYFFIQSTKSEEKSNSEIIKEQQILMQARSDGDRLSPK